MTGCVENQLEDDMTDAWDEIEGLHREGVPSW